jgi:hypothetical protein
VSRAVNENGARVLNLAGQHGEKHQVSALRASLHKLQGTSEMAEKTLGADPREKSAGAGAD